MTAIIDINDATLGCWSNDHWERSPAYAWFDGGHYHYGEAAARTARLTPRSVNTRYWWQLSTDPLTPALGPARHTADLVHGHLKSLYAAAGHPDSVVIVAPGSMSRAQLSLLLGIAGTLPFSIEAIIHRSALFSAALGTTRSPHVELQLHQTLVTSTERRKGVSHAGESQQLPGRGLLALQDRLASIIAGRFVEQTRFDPQRKAASEQTLFDALFDLLADIKQRGEARLTIDGYQARITAKDLQSIGQELSTAIATLIPEDSETIVLDSLLGMIPGFSLPFPTVLPGEQALPEVIEEKMAELRQPADSLSFQRAVPISGRHVEGTSLEAPADIEQAGVLATHLLSEDTARALGCELALFGTAIKQADGKQLILDGPVPATLEVNGARAEPGQTLRLGDVLSNGDVEARLVRVED
ncbi:hypothetical protein NOR51B_2153 [Luminiphilus syltensis NOR5-1B]|uniref:Uncharacterized protein n=1 Tax=Luminiphilus syltensis NOR5-1B TaxID=565045 RepID=B8KW36_9GAMM|nr:hypothetical protein [Luminiphilus syltensis]EED36205.1 hypothetical protein NOR51B_2153 [Luminiphilus syltensis NOR5-1B]